MTGHASSTADGGSIGDTIIHHVVDTNVFDFFGKEIHLPHFAPIHVFGLTVDLSPTKFTVMLWLAALIVTLMFTIPFRKRSLVPRGIAAALESILLYVRDQIAIASMGEKLGKRFTPYLATVFFFILVCNLLGLIPFMGTATANLSVTGVLAILTFLLLNWSGMREQGVLKYWAHLAPSGIPKALAPMMFFIELMGLFIKTFALAIRLFANMLGGHTSIGVLLFLIFLFKGLFGSFAGYAVSPISVFLVLFIMLLELLVAFIQAYVFTMLSAIFIGMASHGH